MISNYWHWQWKQQVPSELCEYMLSTLEAVEFEQGALGDNQINTKQRDSDVLFLPANHWIEGLMLNFCRYANSSAKWNFICDTTEMVQIAQYKEGQHYDWHSDTDVPDENGVVRKLSAVIQLSKASDFEGGGLVLEGNEESLLSEQGDVVVFPSYTKHRALPVTSGKRVTAVMWMVGPAFR